MSPAKEPAAVERAHRKTAVGRVVSDKMDKTIVVQIERIVRDPRFGKFLKKYSKCYAHDEKREGKRGDLVEIMETRPLSRLKRWRFIKVIEKSTEPAPEPAPAKPGPKKA